MHDLQNPGIAVGEGESTTIMSKFEYADDAALVDADAATATAIVTALAAGSLTDAAMVISQAKSKVMHIHRKTHVSSTTEAEVEALKLAHKCDACSRTFPTQRGMKIHAARWCDGGVRQRSRRGSLADRAVQTAKRRSLSHGHRTSYIRLALQHMDIPPVVARVEAEDVPACCVFDADTRI